LPFTGVNHVSVAVDAAGNLYVTDDTEKQVLELPAGSASQEVLPFTGLDSPKGVAVDTAGTLCVPAGEALIQPHLLIGILQILGETFDRVPVPAGVADK
jgi:hypothetical protein